MYRVSEKRIKEMLEELKLPSLKAAFDKDELQVSDIITEEEEKNMFWRDYSGVAENILLENILKFSIDRQKLYTYNKIWYKDDATTRGKLDEIIFNKAVNNEFPTHEVSTNNIKKEVYIRAQTFEHDAAGKDLTENTRYSIYVFPNGTLYYDSSTGDYEFKKDYWNPNDEVKYEENPPFNFDFIENTIGINNAIKKMVEWEVSAKQILYFISYMLFFKKDFLNVILYLVGEGSNGKSQLLKLIHEICPDGTVTSFDISKASGDKDGSQVLQKAYANVAGEISLDSFDTTFFKKITGGDTISVNVKNEKDLLTFTPTAKHIVSSNSVPRLKTTTHGDLRRILILEFNKTFPLQKGWFDINLKPYIPQIFYLCLLLSKKIINNGMYIKKDLRIKSDDTIQNESSSVYSFIKEFEIIKNSNSFRDIRSLYKKYRIWSKINGKNPVANSRFSVEIERTLGKDIRIKGEQYKRAIKITHKSEFDEIQMEDYT